MNVCVLKLNGWPDAFDERIEALSKSVDRIDLIRPKPDYEDSWEPPENVRVHDVYPRRGPFVKPGFLKPIVFPLHVFQAVFLLWMLLLRRNDPPDVVHAFDYVLGGVAGAVATAPTSIPLVVSVRGLKEPRYRSMVDERDTLTSKAQYRILTLLSGPVIRRADHIVTKSKYQVSFVREEFGVDPGFTTVPTGVDFERFDPAAVSDESAIRSLLEGADGDEPLPGTVVLYLGKLIPEKGPDRILEFVAETDDRLPDDVGFVFVGECRYATFEDRIRELQREIPGRFSIYPQRVPFEQVPDLLADADAVTLLPVPDSEGVPRVLQESCAMQTPIIASDVTGVSGAFEGLPGCYLIDRDDPDAFARAVTEVANAPPEMDRSLFRERFDIDRNYAKYADVYESLHRTPTSGTSGDAMEDRGRIDD